MTRAHPYFKRVFNTYDDLNASVQENVNGIRVVKAYVREEHEDEKFKKTSTLIYKLFVKAENYLVFNMPLMQLTVYGCIIGISWFGAHLIVGGNLTTGELTSLFTYVMMILMSLMMFSMVFVMVVMSIASAQRISEVINENQRCIILLSLIMKLKMVQLILIMLISHILMIKKKLIYVISMFILNLDKQSGLLVEPVVLNQLLFSLFHGYMM